MISVIRSKLLLERYLRLHLKKSDPSLPRIGLLDPSLGSLNIGDEIISDCVNEQLSEIFPDLFIVKGFTQQKNTLSTSINFSNADLIFVGGSNLISKNVVKYNQWVISLYDYLTMKRKIIFMGVGNWKYQPRTNTFTKGFYKRLMNQDYIHSVRDDYTRKLFNEIGINNVITTSCPTMWKLTKEFCKNIPVVKSDNVVFTITDYGILHDYSKLINILLGCYSKVYFFPQGSRDISIFRSLGFKGKELIRIIPPNLREYDKFLMNEKVDYVGTRLHGGIRALQKGRRSLIIGIDNRAVEKNKDFNLPMIEIDKLELLKDKIFSNWETSIIIPEEEIKIWKNQFLNRKFDTF